MKKTSALNVKKYVPVALFTFVVLASLDIWALIDMPDIALSRAGHSARTAMTAMASILIPSASVDLAIVPSAPSARADSLGPVLSIDGIDPDARLVSDRSMIVVSAHDESHVAKISVSVDGFLYASCPRAQCDVLLESSQFLSGPHLLQTEATDSFGNSTRSLIRFFR